MKATFSCVQGSHNLGPHSLVLEVSRPYYTTKTFDADLIYVQGNLAAPSFTYITGESGGTADSGNKIIKFSYLTYDKMPFSVTVGNTVSSILINAIKFSMTGTFVSAAPPLTVVLTINQFRATITNPAAEQRGMVFS